MRISTSGWPGEKRFAKIVAGLVHRAPREGNRRAVPKKVATENVSDHKMHVVHDGATAINEAAHMHQ